MKLFYWIDSSAFHRIEIFAIAEDLQEAQAEVIKQQRKRNPYDLHQLRKFALIITDPPKEIHDFPYATWSSYS